MNKSSQVSDKKGSLPRISVVVPVLNMVDTVERTLRSIISQEYKNLEVIVRDGVSTDGTLEVLNSYSKRFPKILRLTSEKDKGQTDALNKGFKEANGDIVGYINADDQYEEGAFKKVADCYLESPQTLWIAGKGRVFDENDKEVAPFVSRYKNWLLRRNKYEYLKIVNYLFQPSVFLKRETFEKFYPLKGNDSAVMEYDLWLKIGNMQMPALVDDYLSKFYLRKGSLSTTRYREILKSDNELAKKNINNPFIYLLHYLHNLGRKLMVSKTGLL